MNPQKLQFSKSEAIKFGWNTTKSNLKFFIVLFLVLAILIVIISLFQGLLQNMKIPALSVVAFLISWIVNLLLSLILYKIWFTFLGNKRPTYQEIVSIFPQLPKFALASILYALAIFGSFILILIPFALFGFTSIVFSYLFKNAALFSVGIILLITLFVVLLIFLSNYFALKYQFFGYFIIALGKDVGPIGALKLSGKITKGVKLNLLTFSFLSSLIIFVGILALGVGLVVAIPTVGIAHAYIFKKLISQTQPVIPAPVS